MNLTDLMTLINPQKIYIPAMLIDLANPNGMLVEGERFRLTQRLTQYSVAFPVHGDGSLNQSKYPPMSGWYGFRWLDLLGTHSSLINLFQSLNDDVTYSPLSFARMSNRLKEKALLFGMQLFKASPFPNHGDIQNPQDIGMPGRWWKISAETCLQQVLIHYFKDRYESEPEGT